jgi:hypothetical protein
VADRITDEGFAMTNRKRHLKLVAFVPAIVLGGGFIGFRAGAVQFVETPPPQPEPAAEQQPVVVQRVPAEQLAELPATPEHDPTYMAGSKSFRPVVWAPSSSDAPVFLGGSKTILIFSGDTQGLTPAPDEKPPVFLGGSKRGDIFSATDRLAPPPEKPQRAVFKPVRLEIPIWLKPTPRRERGSLE